MQTILKAENIQKYYKNKGSITKAVDNISFEVEKVIMWGSWELPAAENPPC